MIAIQLFDRRTAVYRLYDAADTLLYVGVSWNPTVRLGSHAVDKAWWPQVARTAIEWHNDRVTALQHEAQAILDEDPQFNAAKPIVEHVRKPAHIPAAAKWLPGRSCEWLAVSFKVSVSLIKRMVRSGTWPHSCDGPEVWFSERDLEQIDILTCSNNRGPQVIRLQNYVRGAVDKALAAKHCTHLAR